MKQRGNKKLIKRILLATTLFSAWEASAQSLEITAQDMQRHDAVKEIFDDNCAACHGYDGIPMLPGTPNFVVGERLDKSDEELLETIANGKDLMPPWGGDVDQEQRNQLLNYIRGIAGEQVFQQKCSACHQSSIPAVSGTVPGGRKAVLEYQGDINLCTSDVEESMSRKEIADVLDFLTSLKH